MLPPSTITNISTVLVTRTSVSLEWLAADSPGASVIGYEIEIISAGEIIHAGLDIGDTVEHMQTGLVTNTE